MKKEIEQIFHDDSGESIRAVRAYIEGLERTNGELLAALELARDLISRSYQRGHAPEDMERIINAIARAKEGER
jgi:hypothetical protein